MEQEQKLFERRIARLLSEHEGQLGKELAASLAALSSRPYPKVITLEVDDDLLKDIAPDVEPGITFSLLAMDDDLKDSLRIDLRAFAKTWLPEYITGLRSIVVARVDFDTQRAWLLNHAGIDASDTPWSELQEAVIANLGDGTIPFSELDEYL